MCWRLTHVFSYGTAKSGVGISAMSVLRPDLMMKCVIPVIMAGIIAVSTLPLLNLVSHGAHPSPQRSTVSSCLCSSPETVSAALTVDPRTHAYFWPTVAMEMTLFQGFVQLGAGLSVGLAGLAAGFAIGVVGDAGVRGTAQQPRLFVGMVSFLCSPHSALGGDWNLGSAAAGRVKKATIR